MASILEKNDAVHNSLDNIDNLLTICYVLMVCTLMRERDKEKEKGGMRRRECRIDSVSVGGQTPTGFTRASEQVIPDPLDPY